MTWLDPHGVALIKPNAVATFQEGDRLVYANETDLGQTPVDPEHVGPDARVPEPGAPAKVIAGVGRKAKKRRNGEGTIRQRPDGIWEARYLNAHGVRQSVYGSRQSIVRDKIREARKLEALGGDPKAGDLTLSRFLELWLTDSVAGKLAPKTVKSYRDRVRLQIEPTLGKKPIGKVTPQDVQRLLRAKETEPVLKGKGDEPDRPLSARSVALIRDVLRAALNKALRWGFVPRNVAALADPPRQVQKEVRSPTQDEALALLEKARGDRYEALYRLGITLGLRIGEALALRWEDVDLDAGSLKVRATLQRVNGELIRKEPKTRQSRRTLTLPPSLVTTLRAHRDRQAWDQRLAGAKWQETGYVFVTGIGTPVDPSNIQKRFKTLLVNAGLPKEMTFHGFRHCAVSLMAAEGVPLPTIMAVLGHSQIATTMNIYNHVAAQAHQHAADAMERALTGKQAGTENS